VEGPNLGREFDLADSALVIGRDASAGIVLDDSESSRKHASIWTEGASIMLDDLGSTNGTFVNGERLSGTRTVSEGDRVRIGTTVFEVRSLAQATQLGAAAPEEPAGGQATRIGAAAPDVLGEPPAGEPLGDSTRVGAPGGDATQVGGPGGPPPSGAPGGVPPMGSPGGPPPTGAPGGAPPPGGPGGAPDLPPPTGSPGGASDYPPPGAAPPSGPPAGGPPPASYPPPGGAPPPGPAGSGYPPPGPPGGYAAPGQPPAPYGQTAPTFGAYPIEYEADYPSGGIARWRAFFQGFLLIPHLFALLFVGMAAYLAFFFAWWAILFTGRYPGGLFNFIAGTLQWSTRAGGFGLLMTERYPPFALGDDPAYPIRARFQYPASGIARWRPLLHYIMAIPHMFALYFVMIGVYLALIIVWFSILFTRTYPPAIFNFIAGAQRWNTRLTGYVLLMTEEYPPFGLA
jgi:hypothetical protein